MMPTNPTTNVTIEQPTPGNTLLPEKIEPIVKWLFGGVFVGLSLLILTEKFLPSDGQLFQVVAAVTTGLASLLGYRIKPKGADNKDAPVANVTQVN